MPKVPLQLNVYDAAMERIKYTYDNFEKVYISFSGGKDSTVMAHMALTYARSIGRKTGLLLIDLEAQYRYTMQHCSAFFAEYADIIEPYWMCERIALRNAVSVYEPKWICWDEEKQDVWVRPKPAESKPFEADWNIKGIEFEEFVPKFGEWYGQGKSCACMVGIRSDESLNRYRTIASTSKETHGGKQWTTRVVGNVYNIYPVYDWNVEDLWIYHAKNPDKRYNKLYDAFHKSGLTLSQMRICQPYGDDQRRGLWLYHIIEPDVWTRVVNRVSGVNSGALYINEKGNVNGYGKINVPDGYTWKKYAAYLLHSMPDRMRVHYENKIALYVKWWTDRGYSDTEGGIPDLLDAKIESKRLAPSWRRVCKVLLRNDYWCKGLSFTQHKSEAYEKYLTLMKKKREGEHGKVFSEVYN
jgi:predicted phosphoadenosine phosphosulfate sulfurtransferase